MFFLSELQGDIPFSLHVFFYRNYREGALRMDPVLPQRDQLLQNIWAIPSHSSIFNFCRPSEVILILLFYIQEAADIWRELANLLIWTSIRFFFLIWCNQIQSNIDVFNEIVSITYDSLESYIVMLKIYYSFKIPSRVNLIRNPPHVFVSAGHQRGITRESRRN